MKTHLSRAIPLAFLAGLMLAVVRFGGGGDPVAGHPITATPGVPQFHVEIDMVKDGNTFCNPVDDSGTEAVGSTYRVAVCATDIPTAIRTFMFHLLYDKTLNQCNNVVNSGWALDDNPDANVPMPGASGTASAGGNTTLTDDTQTWTTDQWAGYRLMITGGTGVGQIRTIASNTDTVLTVSAAWTTNPSTDSIYEVLGSPQWPNPVTGDDLGGGWDCSCFGQEYPVCDRDLLDDPPNLGRAHLCCVSMNGPWTLGDNETAGVLGTVQFKVIGTGADTLRLENVRVYDTVPDEIGSCNPSVNVPIPCFDATDDKTPATPTLTPAAVGGIAEVPDIGGASAEEAGASGDRSGWSAGDYAALAGGLAVAAFAIAVGGWYARRRWLR